MSQGETRNSVEHSQAQQQKQDQYSRRDRIQELVDKCSRALARGERRHYQYVAKKLDESLIPLVSDHVGRPLEDFDRDLADHELWYYSDLTKFLERRDHYREQLESDSGESSVDVLALQTRGLGSGEAAARTVVDRAFRSVAAIAEDQEIIEDELRNRVDAVGFSQKIGEHLQDWEMNIGDPVRAVTDQTGTLKTLFTGGTGQGKSVGLETELEDFYQRNFQEGRSYKILDIVGLRDGENWFYDIPQQDGKIRHKREDQGLDPAFDESDELEAPTVEILVPLTPGLSERRLPYDVDAERFSVRPFVIPASDLSKPLLVKTISARLGSEEESLIRQAYDDVSRSDDWSLRDLAGAIKDRSEISPKNKKKAIGTLRSLQNEGFIRTGESEHTLEWESIFRDTETITVFSQALLEDEIAQLLVVASLLETIERKRSRMHGLPEAVLVARELWKIAGHKGRQGYDERAKEIKQVIAWILTGVFRENRHYGLHLLADTQSIGDLLKEVRELFNRYVVFTGTWDHVKDIFDWTNNEKNKSFYGTLNAKRGQAGIVGQVEPAIKYRRIEFLSPVDYVGPSFHHRMKGTDQNGWSARARYLGGSSDVGLGRTEILERPIDVDGIEWDDEIPDELEVRDLKEDGTTAPDPSSDPIAAFAFGALDQAELEDWTHKSDIYTAYNGFLRDQGKDPWDFDDRGSQTQFGKKLRKAFDGTLESVAREGAQAFAGVTLTSRGEKYLRAERDRRRGETGTD